MYTVSSWHLVFPVGDALALVRVMLLLGEVRECREVTFTKECERPVTERTRLLSFEARCVNSDRGVLYWNGCRRSLVSTGSSPLIREGTRRSVTLQSITDVKPASPVANHCTPLRCHPDDQLLQVLLFPTGLICLYFLFIFLSRDRYLHQS